MPSARASRAWRALLAAGMLVVCFAFPLYHLTMVLLSQIGSIRALGTLAPFSLLALLVGLLVSLVWRGRLPAALRTAVYAGALANMAAIGLMMHFQSPALAPGPWKVAAGALWVGLVAAFWWRGEQAQSVQLRLLAGLGLAALASPLAALPVVGHAWIQDRPRLAIAPPPADPAHVRPDAPRRIVLVTFDGFRARSSSLHRDSDAPYGMAAIARSATTFTNFRAAGDETLMSTPAILSGLRPKDWVSIDRNKSSYGRQGSMTGMAGHLAQAGYRAYFATTFITPHLFGMGEEYTDGLLVNSFFPPNDFNTRAFLPVGKAVGWLSDRVARRREPWKQGAGDNVRATRMVFDAALGYWRRAEDKTFLWVHVGAPHAPFYRLDERERDAQGLPRVLETIQPGQVAAADGPRRQVIGAIYDRYARFAEAELERFIGELRRDPAWAETMLIVTADHGEELGLPGKAPHGNGILTEDVSHVPLLIREPGQREARRDTAVAGHTDLLPTVLSRVFDRLPEGLSGRSLLADRPADRVVYTWSMLSHYVPARGQAQSIAAFQGHHKLVLTYPEERASLYDLHADPRAEHDVSHREPALARRLEARLRREMAP